MDSITSNLKTVILHKEAFKPVDIKLMLRTDQATKTCLNAIVYSKHIKMISANRKVTSLHFESLLGCFNPYFFITWILCPFCHF